MNVNIKKIAAAVTMCVLTLVLFLIFGEIYARMRHDKGALGGFANRDPVFHHIPAPYINDRMYSEGDFDVPFTTNNRGIRKTRNCLYEKPKGVFRIAVLGDSFTFGVGVKDEEVFTSILEKSLNAGGTFPYEVLNFGIPSYSPILEYIYLKKEVIKYGPDLVILMLDESDIYDDYLYEPHIVYSRSGEIEGCDPLRLNGRPGIWAHCVKYSRLMYMLDNKLLQSVRKIMAIGPVNYISNKLKGKRNKTEILLNKDIDNVYFDRFLMFREGKNKDIVAKHWRRTAGYIKMIKDYSDAKGIRFLLVVYPYGHQVGPDFWNKGRTAWGFEPGKTYDPSGSFAVIEKFAKAEGMDFLNLYDGLREKNNEFLYYERDGHWTAAGHRVVSGIIFNSNVFRRDLA